MNKDLIAKRFGKNLETYNENAKIQKLMAEKLVSYIEQKKYKNILEIGCGTGILTQKIIDNFKFDNYIANDIVSECSNFMKEIMPDIKFIHGDIEECINYSTLKYDLIIANACFQWIENLEELLKILVSKLSDNGKLVFSTFGTENFRELSLVQGERLLYYSKSELDKILQNYNHTIEEEIRVLAFKSPKDILKHIKFTGVNAVCEERWTKSDLESFTNSYNNFCSGNPTLTYNPIYVTISK